MRKGADGRRSSSGGAEGEEEGGSVLRCRDGEELRGEVLKREGRGEERREGDMQTERTVTGKGE